MRSIMKPVEDATSANRQTEPGLRPANGGKPRKKKVRFDDMILIGDDQQQVQIFLSDEEASIIEKKATPTKINLQSSAELRKRLRLERQQKIEKAQRKAAKNELTLDSVLAQQHVKRKRVQTTIFGQHQTTPDSVKNTQSTTSPEDQEPANSDGSSPEKHDMSQDFDCSYESDSDVGGQRSRLKKRRSKKHRKDKRKSQSPSPSKGAKRHKGFDEADYDDNGNEHSHDSQTEQARRVAEAIKG